MFCPQPIPETKEEEKKRQNCSLRMINRFLATRKLEKQFDNCKLLNLRIAIGFSVNIWSNKKRAHCRGIIVKHSASQIVKANGTSWSPTNIEPIRYTLIFTGSVCNETGSSRPILTNLQCYSKFWVRETTCNKISLTWYTDLLAPPFVLS